MSAWSITLDGRTAFCVAAEANVPAVMERRRVATIDNGLPTMPYQHEPLDMPENEANYTAGHTSQ